MSTLEKPTENYEASEPAAQAGIFLKEHLKQQLFDQEGRLIEGAVQNIQRAVLKLGKAGVEFAQTYEGFVAAQVPVGIKDEKGRPTGETKWADGQLPGPDGVECVIYTRHTEF